jgi:hypothetical protein
VTTAEMERRLAIALRGADEVAVDLAGARQELVRRQAADRRSVLRVVVAVAASVVLVAIIAASVLQWLGDRRDDPPLPSEQLTISPSGLPVGVLRWSIPTTKAGWTLEASDLTDDVTLTVLPDGRGIYWREATGEPVGFDVRLESTGSGSAVVRYTGPRCKAPRARTLVFTVHGRQVTVHRATARGVCVVPVEDAEGLAGTTVRVRPLPGTG